MKLPLSLLVFVIAIDAVLAQQPADAPTRGDAMMDEYLKTRTPELSRRFLDGARSKAAWEEKRPRLLQEHFEMLGLSPLPEKTPLQLAITGTVEHGAELALDPWVALNAGGFEAVYRGIARYASMVGDEARAHDALLHAERLGRVAEQWKTWPGD